MRICDVPGGGDVITEEVAAKARESIAAHDQQSDLADSLHTGLTRFATKQGYLSKVIARTQLEHQRLERDEQHPLRG